MDTIRKLLLENRAWAKGHKESDPDYFGNMAKDQSPKILWIGCADSRVPPDTIVNARPGSLFVHRNIANLVYTEDENLMSVLEYAVKYLKVSHIIVCGHYNCGGVKAAFDGIDNKVLSDWTKSIQEIKAEKNPSDLNKLVEMNVSKQVENIKNLPLVKDAIENGHELKVFGLVYDLAEGELIQI